MRVLSLAWEYPPHVVGGLGRHVHHLTEALAERGVENTVITFSDGSSQPAEAVGSVNVLRVNPYSMRYPDFVSWVHGLNTLITERAKSAGPFDLIHVHDWLTATSGIALKHIYRRPLVATIHSTEIGRRVNLKNETERHIHDLEWWLAYEAWKVICCSNYMEGEVSRNLLCPCGKIAVIPNGFKAISGSGTGTCAADVAFDRQKYAREGESIILYVGRLVYEKGPHLIMEAAQRLRRDDLKFIMVGEGPMRTFLRDLAAKLGVNDRVSLLGHVPDSLLSSLYKNAAVAVFPSLYEPFGIVALEAMGYGTPVLASDTGGLGEIVRSGYNGMKFTCGSPDSLATTLGSMVGDGELLRRVSANGRSCLSGYSWSGAAESTLDLYSRVMSEYAAGSWKPRA